MERICNFTIRQMLAAGVHIGHVRQKLNPKMTPYILGERNGIHIIDLEKTEEKINIALNFIKKIASQNGRILFVSTRNQFSTVIDDAARKCGQYYVSKRWLGGMLTNRSTVMNSIGTMRNYEEQLNDPNSRITKKERSVLQRKFDNLHRNLGGIRNMGGLPDMLVVIGREKVAISEAKKLRIPICAIADTNFDPEGIDYIIPGNDDSIRSVSLYCELFATAALLGIQESLGSADINISAPVAEESAAAPQE